MCSVSDGLEEGVISMNEYQRERMRRRENEQRQRQIALDAENSRSRKRRTAVLIASILALVGAILVITPMRLRAIASNDLDDVEQYLMENIDETIVGADSVVDAQMSAQSEDEGNAFMMFAESVAGTEKETVDTTDRTILTKFLLVDSEFVQDGMQFGDLYSDEDLVANAVISQYMNELPLLDPGESSNYYVAMLDTTQFNGAGRVIDADFAWTNTLGQVIEDVIYDQEKGIAYIPKFLYESYDAEDVDISVPVQAQLLVSYDLSAQADSEEAQTEVALNVISEIYDVRATDAHSFSAATFDTSVTFPVVAPEDAGKIGKQNLLVCVGGSDFPMNLGDENSSYDSDTGELTVAVNAMTLTSVNVTIVSDDVITSFIDEITQPQEAEAVSPDSMETWTNGALSNLNKSNFKNAISKKTVYTYNSKVLRFTKSNKNFSGFTAEDKGYQKAAIAATKFVYGGDSTKNRELVADIVQGDDFSKVVNDNKIGVNKEKGRSYYWNESGGVNEAFAFPGCEGVSATVSQVKRGTSYPLDFTGLQSLTNPGTNKFLVGAGLCSHIENSTEASTKDEKVLADVKATYHVQNTYVIMRPLYIDKAESYVIVAFIGARLSTQSGVGVYKFRIQQPGYAKVLKTSTEPDVTNGSAGYSFQGTKYDLYADQNNAKSGKNSIATINVKADGTSDPVSVKPGSYWAKETASAPSFELNPAVLGPYAVKDGQTVVIEAKDSPKKGTISVKKQDAETGKGLASGTYKMSLYAADKTTVLKSVEITKDETVSFGTYGFGTYYVHEDFATFPYMTEEFAVDANAAWHEVQLNSSQQTVPITISDQQRRGEIILKKVDEAGQPIPNTAFALYANQDVTSLDGTVRHKKGEKVIVNEKVTGDYVFDPSSKQDTLYTDAQGNLKVTGLYLTPENTSFQLVEVAPAPGYLRDTTPVVFNLAKDETVKVISATQTMINRENGIDIYTYEELDGETPETPDPDDPHGGYPNVPVPNKFVGVWKEGDGLSVEMEEGTNAIAIRTPNGDASYRPTLVPTDEEIPQGNNRADTNDKASAEENAPEGADAETASAESVASGTLVLKALAGNTVNMSDEDAKALTDARISLSIKGQTIGQLAPRTGAYQVVFPTLKDLQNNGKAPTCSEIPGGWSYQASQPRHDVSNTTVTNNLTLTHGTNKYNYTITYVVADSPKGDEGSQPATKQEDEKQDVKKGETEPKKEDEPEAGKDEPVADKKSLATIVAEWDAAQNAWIAKGLAPNTAYKVLIASKMVATTPSDLAAGHVLYARYSIENSEFFPKGWVDQAGLPKDDSLYVYKGLTDASAHVAFNRIPAGKYLISEIKPPVDESGNFTYLADRKVHAFVVDDQTGLIKDVDDLTKGNHTDASGVESQRQIFVIREARTHLLINKRSSETGKDVSGAQLILTNEEHVVIDQWTSDGSAHAIDGLVAGTYYLSEAVTPQNYDKATTVIIKLKPISTPQTVVMYDAPIVVGVRVDKRQEIADPLDERVMENGDGKNNADLSVDKFGIYDYSIDARSTSNSWVDEFTVTDEPKAITDGMARLVSVSTPQAWQDYDGKMNVWYKTNKTPVDYKDESGANATTSDGHDNPWLTQEGASGLDTDGDKRVGSYDGWKLWKAGLSTMVSTKLEVAELGLAEDEYVTGVSFEYGRVEMGFTTRPADWDRELLKDKHDDVSDILGADRMTFDAADAAADASISTLNNLVSGFATDASRAAESVVAQRTKDEELAYQKLVSEIEAYNNQLAPDSDLPRKFIDAPSKPAYLGEDDAVTKLTAARDAAKVSIRAIFETSETAEGKVALSEALPGLKALVSGATDADTATIIEQKVNNLVDAIGNADADAMAAIQASLIEDLDDAVDQIINTGLSGRVHYAPAILRMQVTDKYVADKSLTNGAGALIARNGGGARDNDGTGQTTKTDEPTTSDSNEDEQKDKQKDEPKDEHKGELIPVTDFDSYPLAAFDTDENFQSAKPRVIEIDTNLTLPDGKKVIDVESGQLNIIDHVNLKGLTPGKEYILVGDIHSRMGTEEDGFIDAGIVKNESGQPAKSEMKFIPDTENTSVDVPFTIDVASLNAYPAVAFEELHESIDGKPGNLILAEHKEISDPDQTLNLDPVQFEETRIVPEQIRRMFRGTPIAQTGDAVLITGAAIIAVMLIAGIVFWRRRNRA